jgi:hypothetical protein
MKFPATIFASAVLTLGVLAHALPAFADDLYLGPGSIQLFDINDLQGGGTTPSGSFGPAGAVTGVPDGQGNVWVVSYDSTSGMSIVQKYDGAGSPISGDTFQISGILDNGVVGPGGNLFFSTASGEVYEYSSSTLTSITNWNIATGNSNLSGTQYTAIGIASDGTNLYTTEGDAGSFIDKWSSSGTLESSIDVGLYGLYGLGLDGAFFAGTPGYVLELDSSGALENDFAIGADNFFLSAGAAPSVIGSAPEPGTLPVMALAGLVLGGIVLARRRVGRMKPTGTAVKVVASAAWAIPLLMLPIAKGQVSLSITPSASSANIGSMITVSASASDPGNGGATFTYQFNLLPPGSSNYSLIRDYSPTNSFPFTTTGSEGMYTIQVIALESNGSTASGTTQLTYNPVATSSTGPVVSATAHPLVAMYSLPPCPAGSLARVHFQPAHTFLWQYTPYQACTGNTSLNFLIGGLRGDATYVLQHDIFTAPYDTLGPKLSFTTQAIPSSALNAVPSYGFSVPASGPNATAYPVLLTAPVGGGSRPLTPFAIDTGGNVIWYLPDFINPLQAGTYLTRPVPGGTFLVIANLAAGDKQLLREYDLAGNILRETNATAISNQLAAQGKDRITSISHEIFRFPNGDTGFIGTVEKAVPTAFDSSSNTTHSNVDIVGDMAVVLDPNFHLKWSWNEFDYATQFSATTTTGAPLPAYTGVLDETCAGGAGCAPILNVNPSNGQAYTIANDWTHSNSLAPTPDGNLIISIRHQDMVVKINYNNGSGDGSILWRLGPQGDFASSVPAGQTAFQFFNSHEHDVQYDSNGLITMFDNGNSRVSLYGGNSRGQAWQVNETNMTATPVVNIDLGIYSLATGSAQRLADNSYHFYLGDINNTNSQSVEATTSGADEFKLVEASSVGYRSFRMNSLYSVEGAILSTPFYAWPK